jgi:hypothetical protein
MKYLAVLILVAAQAIQAAQAANFADANLFVQALVEGSANAAPASTDATEPVFQRLRASTGNPGPFLMVAKRLVRFEQQSKCGRVVFMLTQPGAHRGWPDIGGQLNICENGSPPWRVCKKQPTVLVPHDQACSDATPSVDTPEVAKAVATALANGGLSQAQVLKRMNEEKARGLIKKSPVDETKP